LTLKGQELVESVVSILQWMRKWAKEKRGSNHLLFS
jgi:DNA-binding HxlR family transcriptional regulator